VACDLPPCGQSATWPHIGRVAADEAGELHRKVVGDNGAGCPQRRELDARVGVAQLHHPFRAEQVTQPVSSQIGQPRINWKLVDDQRLGRARQFATVSIRSPIRITKFE
jgi:hypothetical protein